MMLIEMPSAWLFELTKQQLISLCLQAGMRPEEVGKSKDRLITTLLQHWHVDITLRPRNNTAAAQPT